MLNKAVVQKHFSGAVHSYDKYACVQKNMARHLAGLLPLEQKFKRILEIGCGTGYLTGLLAQAFPRAQIVATDISREMLATTAMRLGNFHNIEYQVLDGENVQERETYDLVIGNAVFQWFTDYAGALQRIYRSLVPGGQLYFATFGEQTFRELQASFAKASFQNKIEGVWRHGPAFIPAPFLETTLQHVGFTTTCEQKLYPEYFPSVHAFLKSIKKVGANNSMDGKHTLVNRNLLLDMMRIYNEDYQVGQHIVATYDVLYFTGTKAG
jgi:malonyl-CoA O-methyltransferase